LTTLEEYALGGDPRVASVAELPRIIRVPGTVEPEGIAVFTFSRPLTHDDAAWQIETATDLDDWQPAELTVHDRHLDAGRETIQFQLPAPGPSHPRHYWRLRIRVPADG
jgi:hypothetical protein